MTVRLADAALFIAVLNRRDRFHSWASEYYRTTSDRFVVPLAVLVEVGNYFGESAFRKRVMAFEKAWIYTPPVQTRSGA